jgi:hypothetical protein
MNTDKILNNKFISFSTRMSVYNAINVNNKSLLEEKITKATKEFFVNVASTCAVTLLLVVTAASYGYNSTPVEPVVTAKPVVTATVEPVVITKPVVIAKSIKPKIVKLAPPEVVKEVILNKLNRDIFSFIAASKMNTKKSTHKTIRTPFVFPKRNIIKVDGFKDYNAGSFHLNTAAGTATWYPGENRSHLARLGYLTCTMTDYTWDKRNPLGDEEVSDKLRAECKAGVKVKYTKMSNKEVSKEIRPFAKEMDADASVASRARDRLNKLSRKLTNVN